MGLLSKAIKFKLAHSAYKKAREMFSEQGKASTNAQGTTRPMNDSSPVNASSTQPRQPDVEPRR